MFQKQMQIFQEMWILKVPKLVVDLDLDLERAKGILMMKVLGLDYHHWALEVKGMEKLMLEFQI